MKKKLKYLALIFFCLSIFIFSNTTSDDFTQDLGRHLKLGEIIFKTKQIPSINLFSYTVPQFPFINHHWLTELVYYISVHFFGINSLIILKVILVSITFFFIIFTGLKNKRFFETIFVSLFFFMPFFNQLRIRPELFGYAFFSFFLFIFFQGKRSKFVYIVPLIMLLWINFHISFVFGLFLLFLLPFYNSCFDWKWILISICLMFGNPHGLAGLLYPFNIFNNYGYSIVENQNIFFLSNYTQGFFYVQYIFIYLMTFCSLLLLIHKKKFLYAIILFIFALATVFQIRHLPFFAIASMFFIPDAIVGLIKEKHQEKGFFILIVVYCFLSLLGVSNLYYRVFDLNRQFGFGFNEEYKETAEYITKNKMEKNIFSTFDIGGYLIYRLYPTYTLFIDNRPEAYPADFVQNTYIRMQENKEVQKEQFKKYHIRTVVLNYTDQTPWTQTFLERMLKDPNWKLVFVNASTVIFSNAPEKKDIRQDSSYILDLINKKTNYIDLIWISQITSLIGMNEQSNIAFLKARKENPDSCIIQKYLKKQFNNPFSFSTVGEVPFSSLWCF